MQQEAKIAGLMYDEPTERKLVGYTSPINEERFTVFQNDNELLIGFKGTSSLRDIFTDSLVLTGGVESFKKSAHFKENVRKTKYAIDRYGTNRRVKLIGHSLGGTTAHEIGRLLDVESTAFNPGSSPFSGERSIEQTIYNYWRQPRTTSSKNRIIRNAYDPLSFFAKGSLNLFSDYRQPHSINTFI